MNIYPFLLAAAVIAALMRFRRADKGVRMIAGILVLGLCTEVGAWYAAIWYRDNAMVYNMATIAESILLCLYFNYSVDRLRRKALGIILAACTLLLGIGVMVSPLSAAAINASLIWYECLLVICLAILALYSLLEIPRSIKFYRKIHFWLPLLLLFGQLGSILSWTLYGRLAGDSITLGEGLHTLLFTMGNTTLLLFILLFLIYPKLRNTHG